MKLNISRPFFTALLIHFCAVALLVLLRGADLDGLILAALRASGGSNEVERPAPLKLPKIDRD